MSDSLKQLQGNYPEYFYFPANGISFDFTGLGSLSSMFLADGSAECSRVMEEMKDLESGALANRDEGRQVGHFWLRNSRLAPDSKVGCEIESAVERVKQIGLQVRSGDLSASNGKRFQRVVYIGMGGSILGPQFILTALGNCSELEFVFCDTIDSEKLEELTE